MFELLPHVYTIIPHTAIGGGERERERVVFELLPHVYTVTPHTAIEGGGEREREGVMFELLPHVYTVTPHTAIEGGGERERESHVRVTTPLFQAMSGTLLTSRELQVHRAQIDQHFHINQNNVHVY